MSPPVQPVLTLQSFSNRTFTWSFAKDSSGANIVPTEQNLIVQNLTSASANIQTIEVIGVDKLPSSTATTFSLSTLSSSSKYLVSLEQIVNDGITSTVYLSNTITLQAVPPPPTITSIVATNNAIVINFTIPSSATVSSVVYFISNSSQMIQLPLPLPTGVSGQYSQSLTSADNSLIANDSQIQVAMFCINSVGDGNMSNAVSVMVGPLPNAPTITSVITVGSGYLISWNAPSDLNFYAGDSKLKAELYDTITSSTLWAIDLTSNPNQGSHLVYTGVAIGQSFSFRMRYINAAGFGAWSALVSYKQLSAPSSVRNLLAAGSNGAITLTWDAPLNDGGIGITGYRILDGTGALLKTVTTLETVISGLTNGNSYTYSVQANNGQYSFASTVTGIPFNISSAPTNVTAVASNQAITLSWGPPSSLGGLPVADYAVEYKKTGLPANTVAQVVSTQGATTTTISQLTNGTAYEFAVYAMTGDKKAKGTSAATIMATPSSTPSYVSATISSPSVAVSVMPNGSPITSYIAIGIFSTGKISYKLTTVTSGMTAYNVSLGTVQLNVDFSTDANITASDTLTNWLMVSNNSTGSSGLMTNISMK